MHDMLTQLFLEEMKAIRSGLGQSPSTTGSIDHYFKWLEIRKLENIEELLSELKTKLNNDKE